MQYPKIFWACLRLLLEIFSSQKDSRSNTKCARQNSQRQLPRKQRQEEKRRYDVYVPKEKEKEKKKKNVLN